MILYVDFETQQFYKWLEEPWDCKIETLGPVYLEGKKDLTSETPEVIKCIQIGTRILVAMKRAIDNNGMFAEIELSDEEFNDICKVPRSKARLVYQGKDSQGRDKALLKYPTFRYL